MKAQPRPRIVISAGRYGSITQVLECARILTSLDRISIVVPAPSTARARGEIAWYDGIELVSQVREQRTTDVLIPLTHVFARDPLANIVFLPAEFSVSDPYYLADRIRAALAYTEVISVIGFPPFDWHACNDSVPVVAIGRVVAFWDLLRRERPLTAALLENYIEEMGTDDAGTALVTAYERMHALDLTRDLLVKLRSIDVSTLSPYAFRPRPFSNNGFVRRSAR